jgi:hypothetical protein
MTEPRCIRWVWVGFLAWALVHAIMPQVKGELSGVRQVDVARLGITAWVHVRVAQPHHQKDGPGPVDDCFDITLVKDNHIAGGKWLPHARRYYYASTRGWQNGSSYPCSKWLNKIFRIKELYSRSQQGRRRFTGVDDVEVRYKPDTGHKVGVTWLFYSQPCALVKHHEVYLPSHRAQLPITDCKANDSDRSKDSIKPSLQPFNPQHITLRNKGDASHCLEDGTRVIAQIRQSGAASLPCAF